MIKRQLINLFWLRAYSLGSLLRHLPRISFYFINGKAGMPLNITLELTNRCNLSCEGCFLGYSNSQTKELSFEEWQGFIVGASKYCKSFYIAGGEPFIRQDIFKVLRLLSSLNVNFGLTTNGTLLNEAKIKQLVATNINYLIFSLDGNKAVHDAIRGEGVYERVTNAIKLFVRYNRRTRLVINTMINPLNYDKLAVIPSIAKQLGVELLSLQHFVYYTEQDAARINKLSWCNIKPIEPRMKVDALLEQIERYERECKRLGIKHFQKPMLSKQQIEQWYTTGYQPENCFLPWSLLRVKPNGDVYFCFPYLLSIGNIAQKTLKQLINSPEAIKFRRFIKSSKHRPGCVRCCKG